METELSSFQPPKNYDEVTTSQGRHGHGLTVDNLTEDEEFWIIRLPKSLELTSLLHTKVKIGKKVTVESTDSEFYSCTTSDNSTLTKYTLLLPSSKHRNFELVPCQFAGEINLTKDEITSQVKAPPVEVNTLCASQIPKDANQRFYPFGTESSPFKKRKVKAKKTKSPRAKNGPQKGEENDPVLESDENNGFFDERGGKRIKKRSEVDKSEETNSSVSEHPAVSPKKKKKHERKSSDSDINEKSSPKKKHKHSDKDATPKMENLLNKSPEKSPKKKRKHSEIEEATTPNLTNDESPSKRKKKKHSIEIKSEVLSETEVESENPPKKPKLLTPKIEKKKHKL